MLHHMAADPEGLPHLRTLFAECCPRSAHISVCWDEVSYAYAKDDTRS